MAQTSARTANQIINAALKRIGNETISAEAQVELNNVLDRLYVDFRWPFLKSFVSGTISQGATSTALPTDFVDLWDRHSLSVIDLSSENKIPITVWSQQEYDLYDSPSSDGTPKVVLVNYNTLTFRLSPLPNQNYGYELFYRAKPTRITNFDAVVNFPNDQLLEQYIFAWACSFEDDERAMGEMQMAEKLMRQFLKSYNVGTGKNSKVSLSPNKFSPMGSFR